MMDLNPRQLLEVFAARQVDHLYHANSLATTLHFLRSGRLLPRGAVEAKGLSQTPQQSDELDRGLGLWFDLFTDSVDIHDRAGKRNSYGPIVLVLHPSILLDTGASGVRVTKQNPLYWEASNLDGRWLASSELGDFWKGRFNQHIVLRECITGVPLAPYLEAVLVDNVPHGPGPSWTDIAHQAIYEAMWVSGLTAQVHTRDCSHDCKCHQQYGEDTELVARMFSPVL